jgi:hypothetical protein
MVFWLCFIEVGLHVFQTQRVRKGIGAGNDGVMKRIDKHEAAVPKGAFVPEPRLHQAITPTFG